MRQIARFSVTHDVICPDLAGFGDSAALVAPDSIEGHARAVLARLDGTGIGRFDLLGHSMGGMIVQEIARLAPDRIRSLTLYGTGPVGVLPGRFETIAASRERLLRDGLEATVRRIAATWFLNGEQADGFAPSVAIGCRASLQAALASLDAWEGWDGREALSAIPCPALILWGSRDRSYPWAQAEALWKGISGAELAVVPGSAHAVHLEKPSLFDDLLADFLSSV
jgi:pimeloyl-ACP methyl ester carboxylesterase